MTRDYETFKEIVGAAVRNVARRHELPVIMYRWRKRSPFQAARYKDEYVFPEVWVKRGDGGMGAVIVGNDVHDIAQTTQLIEDYLF